MRIQPQMSKGKAVSKRRHYNVGRTFSKSAGETNFFRCGGTVQGYIRWLKVQVVFDVGIPLGSSEAQVKLDPFSFIFLYIFVAPDAFRKHFRRFEMNQKFWRENDKFSQLSVGKSIVMAAAEAGSPKQFSPWVSVRCLSWHLFFNLMHFCCHGFFAEATLVNIAAAWAWIQLAGYLSSSLNPPFRSVLDGLNKTDLRVLSSPWFLPHLNVSRNNNNNNNNNYV